MPKKAANAYQNVVFETQQMAIKIIKFKMISKTLSRYLPKYEGLFFSLANSPSAASIPYFSTMKKAAKK